MVLLVSGVLARWPVQGSWTGEQSPRWRGWSCPSACLLSRSWWPWILGRDLKSWGLLRRGCHRHRQWCTPWKGCRPDSWVIILYRGRHWPKTLYGRRNSSPSKIQHSRQGLRSRRATLIAMWPCPLHKWGRLLSVQENTEKHWRFTLCILKSSWIQCLPEFLL